MALVEQLVQGADGHVRAANIRYDEGKKTNWPIAKPYPLEVSLNSNNEVTPELRTLLQLQPPM